MQDERIVELFFERSEQALKETEKKYGGYLMKIAYGILWDKSDCEESINDTYLAAWNSIPPHRPSKLSAYLGKITRRISIDIFRRKTSDKRGGTQYELSLSELEDCVKSVSTVEEDMENKELGEAISRFLRTLSKENRCLFVERYFFCNSLKASAKKLGISESKAKSALYRTRLLLRDFLTKEGFEI